MERKFDPRTIFISTLLLIIPLIIMNSYLTAFFCGIVILLHLYIFGFEKKNFYRIFKYSIGLVFSIIFVNYIFMGKHVEEIFVSLFRLLGIILLAVSLLSSMDIVDIGYSIEKILSPLKIFKIPVETIGTIIAIALKFIPILQEEGNRIMTAQKARGIDFESMNIKERVKNIPTLFLPVIISGIQHSITLAIAMEVRGYGSNIPKTRLYEQSFSFKDWLYLFGVSLFLIFFISYK